MKLGRPKTIILNKCLNPECINLCNKSTTKYCSYVCAGLFRRNRKIGGCPKKIRSKCLFCGKPCKRATTKTCSKSCAASMPSKTKRRKDVYKNCEHCKTHFKLKELSKIHKVKYCSLKCLYSSSRGKQKSPEVRRKLSIAASNRINSTQFTKGIGGIREDIGHYVRSTWEANFARYLKYIDIAYEYEKQYFKFNLDDKLIITYTPDFYLIDTNTYCEVKGWWTEKALLKRKLMAEQYPNINIKYIGSSEYKEIQDEYANKIPNWEFKLKKKRGG